MVRLYFNCCILQIDYLQGLRLQIICRQGGLHSQIARHIVSAMSTSSDLYPSYSFCSNAGQFSRSPPPTLSQSHAGEVLTYRAQDSCPIGRDSYVLNVVVSSRPDLSTLSQPHVGEASISRAQDSCMIGRGGNSNHMSFNDLVSSQLGLSCQLPSALVEPSMPPGQPLAPLSNSISTNEKPPPMPSHKKRGRGLSKA